MNLVFLALFGFICGTFAFDWEFVTTPELLANVSPKYAATLSNTEFKQLIAHKDICTGFQLEQIKVLPNECFGYFSKDCFFNLDKRVFTVISEIQLSHLGPSACAGISGTQLQSMPIKSFEALPLMCFEKFSPSLFAYIDAEQVAKLTSEKCSSLSHGSIEQMPTNVFHSFTTGCIKALNADTSNLKPCRGFKAESFNGLTAEVIFLMNERCVSELTSSTIVGMNVSKAGSFSPKGCSGLSVSQLPYFKDETFAEFSPDCIANLNGDVCKVMKSSQFNDVIHFTFSSDCVSKLPKNVFNNMSGVALAHLPSDICGAFTKLQVSYIDTSLYPSMSSLCVGAITSKGDACLGFSPEGIKHWESSVANGLNPNCLSIFNKSQIDALSGDIINNFSGTQCASLPLYGLKTIMSKHADRINEQCINSLTSTKCSVLDNTVLPQLQLATLGSLPTKCFKYLTNEPFKNLSSGQFNNLTHSRCNQINQQQFMSISSEIAHGVSEDCIANFSATGDCSLLSLDFFNKFLDSSLNSFSLSCMENTSISVKSDFSMKQLLSCTSSFKAFANVVDGSSSFAKILIKSRQKSIDVLPLFASAPSITSQLKDYPILFDLLNKEFVKGKLTGYVDFVHTSDSLVLTNAPKNAMEALFLKDTAFADLDSIRGSDWDESAFLGLREAHAKHMSKEILHQIWHNKFATNFFLGITANNIQGFSIEDLNVQFEKGDILKYLSPHAFETMTVSQLNIITTSQGHMCQQQALCVPKTVRNQLPSDAQTSIVTLINDGNSKKCPVYNDYDDFPLHGCSH